MYLVRRQLVKVTEVLVVVSGRPEPAPGLAWVIATSLEKWRKTTLPTPPTLPLRVLAWRSRDTLLPAGIAQVCVSPG